MFFLSAQTTIAQPPNITYPTPQTYIINTPITPLTPVNNGGPMGNYGEVITLAGTGVAGTTNGAGDIAKFSAPRGIGVAADGNIFVTEIDNNQIRRITPAGFVSTYAGTGIAGYKDGSLTSSQFNRPAGLTFDLTGNMYIADENNQMVRKIATDGTVSKVAGSGNRGFDNGPANLATFREPGALVTDALGNIFVVDANNLVIRKINTLGIVSTFTGTGRPGSTNGGPTTASFLAPYGITIDKAGYLYVADVINHIVRQISPTGFVNTYAGNGIPGDKDAPLPRDASFAYPTGVAIDNNGTLYIADRNNHKIKRVTPGGVVTTLAGTGLPGNRNGKGTEASFRNPSGVAIGPGGVIYVADELNNLIRKIDINGYYTISPKLPAGLTFDETTGQISGTPTVTSPARNYTVTAYNSAGSNSFIVNITVLPASVFTFNPIPDKTVCDADFDAGATGNFPIVYSSDNAAVAMVVAGKIHITGPGMANITATMNGIPKTNVLTVTLAVSPTVSINDPGVVCTGVAVTFTAATVNGGDSPNYQWQVNGISTGNNSSTFTTNSLAQGDIMQCIITSNSTACLTSTTASSNKVIINTLPGTTLSVIIAPISEYPLCNGGDVTFKATVNAGNTAINYQWQVNNINTGNNSDVFTSIQLKAGDVLRCTVSSAAACVIPAVSPSFQAVIFPNPSAKLQNQFIAELGKPVQLNPNIYSDINDIKSFKWSPDNGLNNPNIANPIANPLNTTTYSLEITSVNDCMLELTTVVIVQKPIVIPNTFSPNADGINDTWKINGLLDYPDCLVNIYNRYGSIVYRSAGYSKPWDGTRNGNNLPAATYYYIISFKGNKPALSGNVTILR
ncbi:hypothetical protein GCM10023149_20270 [Mucilaginibacter gynuensis]|uniref:Gliding motility-associated-like protein n=1 Tax=Mucilaginibacter gynuensis TaxID=1302236 RepID=A0ABP8GAV3_9SPHI